MLPNPWMILGAIGVSLGLILASFFYGEHTARLGYEAAIAKQEAQAQTILATANARNAALEATQAELNNQIEATHATATAAIADARSEFDRQLAVRLRNTGRGPSCPSPGSPAPADTGGGANPTPDAGIWVPEQALRDLGALAAQADQLKAYAVACQAFATAVGR